MKTALVLATVVAFLACGALADHHLGGHPEKKVADKDFLVKQMNILKLLNRVHQQNLFKDQVDEGNNYDIEAHIGNYKHPWVVKQFISYYKKGMLPLSEPFSVYYSKHLKQAVMLFELFFHANDFDTLYKTACWTRDRVNGDMFRYSLMVAILHHPETKDMLLPSPYEVYPYYYVKSDIIQKAQKYWMKHAGDTERHSYVITANTTLKNMDDQLSYFMEDPRLNTFNMYYRAFYPSWYNVTEYGHTIDRRGEQFYYTYQQIYARYMLERLSNGMPEPNPFTYNTPFQTAYNPNLRYSNGEEMPPRPKNLLPKSFDIFYVSDIKNYEKRVAGAIDLGYVIDENDKTHSIYHDEHGIEYVGQMIEGTANSPHYYFYGSLFHSMNMMLGHIVDPYHKHGVSPSVLEHPETILRDPGFYQLQMRLNHFWKKYKDRLPRYTHEQLTVEGLKVENVEVGKLYTYIEPFEIDVSNAMYINKLQDIPTMDIRARMHRLNHKHFTFKVEVSSTKEVDVWVRVFLGPKYNHLGNEYDLNERRHYFVELDRFPYQVKTGKTVIERNSQDSSVTSPDPDSYWTMFKKVKQAYEGKSQYFIDKSLHYYGYPQNLLLPKGQKGGQAYTFFVILTPYVKQSEHDFDPYDYKAFSYIGVGFDRKHPDDKPMGFPFDRQIVSQDFTTPNMFFKDVNIFHRKYDEVNIPTH